MSRIEGTFVELALEIGLAETIAETLRDIERAMAALPAENSSRWLKRLQEQKTSLRNPTLRTTAALVVAMCVKDPGLTPRIRRAFADLVERHSELAWFYSQLPSAQAEPLRRAG